MQKVLFGIFVTLLLSTQFSFAQSYILSGIEKTDKEDMQYEVLGKIADHYWIYKKNGAIATIAQYNAQMQLVKQNDLAFLPASLMSIDFVNAYNKLNIFYQFQSNTSVYAAVATLNADGQLMATPKIIETAENIRPGTQAKVFNLLQSDDHQKMAIFSVNTTHQNSIKVKVVALNAQFETVNEATVNVSAQNKKSNLSDFALDNKGNLFCLRNMTLANAAPAVSLLYLAANASEVIESPILNNTLLLDDIRLTIDNANTRIVLNSFYASSKKGNVEGLYTYIWDIASKKEIASNASRFTDAMRSAVSAKHHLKDAYDSYYLDKIIVQVDGTMVIVAESAATYNNHSAFSRWDYYYGGAFYNPYLFSYWNRPFGFYPWARFGWGMGPFMYSPWINPYAGFGYHSVTYNADKVAFVSMDAKGSIQGVKTIDKRQSDMNVDQFIGYGTFENKAGTSFLYYNKEKGTGQFIVHTFTKEGQLARGANIVLAEKRNEWMPRALKQVEDNEVIVPYQFKNRIGFAKIQIK